MKLEGKIPFFIVAALAWIVIISSCANQGMPVGGPRDSIPPVLVGTQPTFKALNYKGDLVRLTFNEFIDPTEVSEALVVSPPLKKRPTVRTKSKSLIVQFNEDLLDSTTYSLDFKNSIADNNEKNPYKSMRFSFSTGDMYDSLRVAGRVMDAFNLEPVENGLVLMQRNLHDSAVYKVRPNYIAKTDENGLFMIDNIGPGKYNIFSIKDENNDLMYNEGSEDIAFWDSLIVPAAHFEEELDTLVSGLDSMLVTGHTHFLPEPLYLRHFTEDLFEQYLETSERDSRYKCTFVFNESVKDTFKVNLINTDAEDWYQLEYAEKMDSIVLWIADTLVANFDSLLMEVCYFQLDSASQVYVQKDTLEMYFTDKEVPEPKRRKKEKEDEEENLPKPIEQFNWQTNLNSTFELNNSILITSPQPVKDFDFSGVKLYSVEDTIKTPLTFQIDKDSTAWRRYKLEYKWESGLSYEFEIDSAACMNIYGISSKKYTKSFKAREDDYYGTIMLNITEIKSPIIVQLLKNNDNEDVLLEQTTSADKTIVFNYLPPDKYKIKIIFDDNQNGKWDSGSFQDKIQPEKVMYINKVLKVRSNWDNTPSWELKPDLTFTKNIRDIELEQQLKKEAEENARKERENPGSRSQNNSFRPGASSGSGIQRR